MKRVLFLNYEYPPLGGGAANATKYLMEEYVKQNEFAVDLVTSAIGDKLEKIQLSENVTIHRLPIGKNESNLDFQSLRNLLTYPVKAYFYSKKLHKENKYDLSHSFFTVPSGFISLILKWQFKIPYIVSLRGSDVPGYNPRFNWLYFFLKPIFRAIWKGSDFTVTNSKGLTELAKETAPEHEFDEIVNGVDTNFYVVGNRTLEDKQKELIILCASRLSKRKGFNYAIEAFSQLSKKYGNIKMIIAGGDGGAMEELKNQVKELGLEDEIYFSGRYEKEDAPEIYKEADIFVMPSLNEGMSNNLLEALSAGLPVLMTDTGGSKELIEDGVNGFILKMKDAVDIAKRLEVFIKESQKCIEFGKASRELAEKMSWESVAREYLELYKIVISKK